MTTEGNDDRSHHLKVSGGCKGAPMATLGIMCGNILYFILSFPLSTSCRSSIPFHHISYFQIQQRALRQVMEWLYHMYISLYFLTFSRESIKFQFPCPSVLMS